MANIVPTIDQEKAMKYCQGYEWNADTATYDVKKGSDLSSMEEMGDRPQPGKRTDLESITEELKKRPLSELIYETEYAKPLAQYHNHWLYKDQIFSQDRMFNEAKEQHNEYMTTRVRNHWEHHLDLVIRAHPDTRLIHWYFDTHGDMGKTVNAKNLLFNHNAFYATGGKAADIYHAYKGQPIVLLNLCASTDVSHSDYIYPIIEGFKDGVVSSGKYNSATKTFKIPHVIVFSNHSPDMTKVKQNRIKAHDVHLFKKARVEHVPGRSDTVDIVCREEVASHLDFTPPNVWDLPI